MKQKLLTLFIGLVLICLAASCGQNDMTTESSVSSELAEEPASEPMSQRSEEAPPPAQVPVAEKQYVSLEAANLSYGWAPSLEEGGERPYVLTYVKTEQYEEQDNKRVNKTRERIRENMVPSAEEFNIFFPDYYSGADSVAPCQFYDGNFLVRYRYGQFYSQMIMDLSGKSAPKVFELDWMADRYSFLENGYIVMLDDEFHVSKLLNVDGTLAPVQLQYQNGGPQNKSIGVLMYDEKSNQYFARENFYEGPTSRYRMAIVIFNQYGLQIKRIVIELESSNVQSSKIYPLTGNTLLLMDFIGYYYLMDLTDGMVQQVKEYELLDILAENPQLSLDPARDPNCVVSSPAPCPVTVEYAHDGTYIYSKNGGETCLKKLPPEYRFHSYTWDGAREATAYLMFYVPKDEKES